MAKELQLAALRKGQITLAAQAELIDRLYDEALAAGKTAMLKARDTGEALAAAKEACKHGEFEPWVESACQRISLRQARNCLRIYTHWDELMEQYGSILYVTSVSAGLESIKKLKPKPEPEPEMPSPAKTHSTKEPVDGTEECPRGGAHTYDQEHACSKCHDPEPGYEYQGDEYQGDESYVPPDHAGSPEEPAADDQDSEPDPPAAAPSDAEGPSESVSVQQLGKAFLRTDQAFGTLTNCLDELHQMHPWQEIAGMQDALGIIYKSFTKWKKESK